MNATLPCPWAEGEDTVDAETVSGGDDLVQVAGGCCLAPRLVLRVIDGGRVPTLPELDQIRADGHP